MKNIAELINAIESQHAKNKAAQEETNSKMPYKRENKLAKYKQSVKTTKKDQLEERNIIKSEILLLAKDLYNKNKINKPLYTKLYNISIGASRLPKLQSTLATLQEIQKMDQVIKKKHFNEKISDAKNEAKVVYNVYSKYLIYKSVSYDDDGNVIQSDSESDEANINERIIGKNNIEKSIKDNIKFYLSYPYIVRVEVLKVIVNKMEVEKDVYRYTGGQLNKQNQIEYFKAWDMGFKYHGYNLDLNDEIPYKCVPNALVKMYGKKDTKRRDEYISAVKNGGVEYVEKCLNNYYDNDGLSLDPLDVDFYDENKIKNRGYTPMDILRFCNEHKIKCFGYDWKLNQFITNKYENIKFSCVLPSFVFYFNDEHIYLIDDKELRNSLLHTNGQSGFISMIANSKKNVSDKEVYVDLPFEDWEKVEKSKMSGCRARWVSFGLEAGSWRCSQIQVKSESSQAQRVRVMSGRSIPSRSILAIFQVALTRRPERMRLERSLSVESS